MAYDDGKNSLTPIELESYIDTEHSILAFGDIVSAKKFENVRKAVIYGGLSFDEFNQHK